MVAKLSKFGFGFELDGFVTFLSWNGMVLSTILGILSMALFAIPADLRYPGINLHEETIRVLEYIMYPCGTFGLLLAMVKFYLNVKLRRDQDKETSLKRICYYLGGLKIFAVSIHMVFTLVMVFLGQTGHFFNLAIFGLPLVFFSLMVHGVRTQRRNLIKAFLIYSYVCSGILIVAGIGFGLYFSIAFMSSIFFVSLLVIILFVYILVSSFGYVIAFDSLLLNKMATFQEFVNPVQKI